MEVALAQLLAGLLVILIVYWLIRDGVRSAIRKERHVEPEQTHAFPVIPDDGPGRFVVAGVDKESGMDVIEHVEAASKENARVKVELKGVVVTSVTRD